MDAGRLIAAATVAGCACLMPAAADAQIARSDFRISPPPALERVAGPQRSFAGRFLPEVPQWHQESSDGLMQRWDLDDGAVAGFGRFSVAPIAHPRSNLEREPMPTEHRTSGIAGAGVRVRF